MKQADDAALIGTIIASAAAASYVRTIPDEQETAGDGSASLTLGYPPETFLSPTAGGKYTDGRDFNGFLNLLSRAIQRLQAGFFGQFNADFAEKIGGYPLGAVVSGDSAGTFWVSTADGNTSAPGGGSTTWISLFNGYALSSWVSGNFVNGTAAGQNGGVQNIQISNYASGLGGASTYLQVTPPGASSFAIPSVGYGNNIWQSKGNYVASNANTSGSSGDLQISAAYYSNSSGAPYLSGYNASGTLTSYILATQDWTNGRFATLDNLLSTNNTLNENTQNLNSALNSTNTQVSNLNDLKISTSTNTSGSGNTKVDSIYYSGAAGKLTIVYYDSSGNQVTKFLTVTS